MLSDDIDRVRSFLASVIEGHDCRRIELTQDMSRLLVFGLADMARRAEDLERMAVPSQPRIPKDMPGVIRIDAWKATRNQRREA